MEIGNSWGRTQIGSAESQISWTALSFTKLASTQLRDWARHQGEAAVVMSLLLPGTCRLVSLLGCGKHMQEPKDKFLLFVLVLHTPTQSKGKG